MERQYKRTQELIDDVKSGEFSLQQIKEKHNVSKTYIYDLAQELNVKLFNTRDCRNHIGERFGRLIVLNVEEKLSSNKKTITTHFICQCDCGDKARISRASLIGHKSKSCGCLLRENAGAKTLENGESMFNHLLRVYKKNAAVRNLDFKLSKEEFRKFTKQNCYYCNREPFKEITHPSSPSIYIYNGIDRINNELGYIVDNCVSCCRDCNTAKHRMTEREFLNLIRLIYENKF